MSQCCPGKALLVVVLEVEGEDHGGAECCGCGRVFDLGPFVEGAP